MIYRCHNKGEIVGKWWGGGRGVLNQTNINIFSLKTTQYSPFARSILIKPSPLRQYSRYCNILNLLYKPQLCI